MTKIPFEKTIEAAYRFAFTNILSVIGAMWLPGLVFAALCAGVLYMAWTDLHALIPPDLGTAVHNEIDARKRIDELSTLFLAFAPFGALISLIGLVLRAMATVGVMEKALGRRAGPVFVYFSLAAPVWRMAGALLLAAIVMIAGIAAICIATGVAIWAADTYAGGIAGLVKFVAVAAASVSIFYATLRLVFFLPAVVVAEERIGIVRAWALGGGNVLRILGVLIAVLLPIVIVAGIVSNMLFGALWWGDLQAAMMAGRSPTPPEFFAIVFGRLKQVWPFFVAFEIVYLALLTGAALGAVANAYKAVAESPA
ncbi:MAG TPA: hypothetical protein VG889_01285 [Rhizomicrobium sp.]|nr:hypothetical protein [Rhizomicrobium sp.]